MKKKAIKYLICIILIVATLILIPIKNVKAETEEIVKITYSDYQKSNKIFCIDKGYALRGTVTYKINEFPEDGIKKHLTGNGVSEGNISKRFFEYIVTESVSETQRSNPETHVPQIAIWMAMNSNLGNIKPELIAKAETLVSIANDYYRYYFSEEKDVPCIEEDDEYAYIYFNEDGSYTPLVRDSIASEGLKAGVEQTGQYVIQNKSYNKRIKYEKIAGSIPQISFKYELKREANLQLWETEDVMMDTYLIYKELENDGVCETYLDYENCYFIKVWEKDGGSYKYNYYCFKCNNEHYSLEDYSAAIRLGMNPLERNGNYYECTKHKIKLEDKNDISKNYGNDNLRNYKVYFTESSKELDLTDDWQLILTYYQRLVYGDGEIKYKEEAESLKPLINPIELSFQKQDFNGAYVSGATIKIEKGTGVSSISANSIKIKNNRRR